ncbi:MAG: hypothetical protein QOG21_1522 [Actinomycetota bacterium]|nr:hypothetical protein [Actinomycetota bacterium]
MKRFISLAVLAFLGAGILVTPANASEGNPNPGVFPPHSHPYGVSYREWGADWFEWAFEAPVATNPEAHPNKCGPGESPRVWFLAVSVGGYETAHCTIPAHKGIAFVAGGGFCSPAVGDPFTTYQGLRRCAVDFVHSSVFSVRASVDNRPIRHLARYFIVSRLIHLRLPDNNFFGDPAGTYPLVVAEYFFVLHPLSLGRHTIKYSDKLGQSPAAITYHVTVTR